jgi:hypothetical protein
MFPSTRQQLDGFRIAARYIDLRRSGSSGEVGSPRSDKVNQSSQLALTGGIMIGPRAGAIEIDASTYYQQCTQNPTLGTRLRALSIVNFVQQATGRFMKA